mmetsp:Transcript_66242/g.191213  ORF Transcript_66242/g.191213 Transcript_66242/m.191213 type:complete len:616 (+) Transcript_66242:108-1955(+)|eukprot:CAMPEP_0176033152 /NCGR_PEP_ID=MMETSP0120_2-20121206/16371_1 /TAXON_ID=160619 /ORGANISM="Kryptoperidinium foliaceum, Strain CCMP 1326" /LENGTH=615 /DNA_ID=CAMNT_0017366475 /DNA_START=105 /DNA_END=1952 /DNA_ORIENTATION=-
MVKLRTKDFNKYAWSSRLTAPVIKVDLIIQCKDLPKKDLLSQADSFCVLWKVPNGYNPTIVKGMPSKLPGRQETEMGRTEVARACMDPTFKHKFRLEFSFHEEQTFIIRVYDEDLRYATDLKEHDYLGGCIFSLGQLMGSKGCTLAKKLARGNSYMIIFGDEIIETREVLEFRFSCQDLKQEKKLVDRSKVLDKCNPYFRLERLNREDQSWEVVWKSEVIKDTLNPTWMEARLPLQLLCNDQKDNPLKITIWDYEKHSSSHDLMGFVESTIAELVTKVKEKTIPVLQVKRERRKLFGGSKLINVGLLKVLKVSVVNIPSVLQYLSGGCSLDVMIGIDCTIANGEMGTDKCLHYAASHYLNDFQAGIQKLGTIMENFSRGKHSSVWGYGAEIEDDNKGIHLMADHLCLGKELLYVYDKKVVENPDFVLGETANFHPLIQAAIFRTIRASKRRQCYAVLCIFTAGKIDDLARTIDLICTAAEDAPLSIVIIGVGNRDFTAVKKLVADESGRLRDSRGIPIARDIVTFVSFKQFAGNATEVISEALKDVPEQFVTHFASNGTKPLPPVPAPDFDAFAAAASMHRKTKKSRKGHKSRSRSTSPMNDESKGRKPRRVSNE